MTTEKRTLDLDDLYKTTVGELLALSDQDLDDLIARTEETYQKARKLKTWLNGIKRQKVSRKNTAKK